MNSRLNMGLMMGMLSLNLLLWGCGGGDEGSTASLIISGTVQAPNGQIVFTPQQNLFEKFANLFVSSVNASVSGISPVADGTQVELVRMSGAGAVLTILAATPTSAGRYSFNLTELGLGFSSDLVVRVINASIQMRAFAVSDTVDIDPVSEAAVQMVIERLASTNGMTLDYFTPQELADIAASIDLFAAVKQINSGGVIDLVAAVKNAVTADTSLMAYIATASGAGQTKEGPGDIGNFFPFTQGNIWRFQGTISENSGTPISVSNTLMIAGTKVLNGVTTTIFTETNPDNFGQVKENYLFKDSRGIINWGNNDRTDDITPQLAPIQEIIFPLKSGSSFEQLNKKGLNFGLDLDFDGVREKADLTSQIFIAAFEEISVPVGSFPDSVKIETKVTITVTLSSDNTKITETGIETEWFAPGIGLIKRSSLIEIHGGGQSFNETATEELIGYIVDGHGGGIRIEVTPTSGLIKTGDRIQFTAVAFDELNLPIPEITFTWNSSNPIVTTVDPTDVAIGLSPGTTTITASAGDVVSNPVMVTVLQAAVFMPATPFETDTGPESSTTGDFNGDGNLDLAVTNFSDTVSILLGTGTGSFGTATNFATGGLGGVFVTTGDLNRDGSLDLAIANYYAGGIAILLGTGTGSFGIPTIIAQYAARYLAIADIDRDGKSDLVALTESTLSESYISIFIGNGDGSFSVGTTFFIGYNSISFAIGDFNGDVNQDLAVSNNTNDIANNVSILLGTGTGSFGVPRNISVDGLVGLIATDDFNRDGNQDLLIEHNTSSTGPFTILFGDGAGSFTPATNFAVGVGFNSSSVGTGDFNGDGKLDLAVANYYRSIYILLGDGAGSFAPATRYTVGDEAWKTVTIGDFNKDGKPDLVVTNSAGNGNSVFVFLNTTP
jgi:hypothetical protein